MEKIEFISKLRDILLQRGYSKESVEAEMIPVKSYFEENGMTDVEIPVEEMADEISDMLKDRGEKPAEPVSDITDYGDIEAALGGMSSADEKPEESSSGKKADKAPSVPEKEQLPENNTDTPAIDTPAEEKADEKADEDEDVKIAGAPVASDEVSDFTPATDIDEKELEKYSPVEKPDDVKAAGFIGKLILKFKGKSVKKEENTEDYPAETDDEYEKKKFGTAFWVLFAIALPFIIVLSALAVLIYIAFWVALALIMIVLIAGLILFVFAGVLVALVGIIYGVIMIIKGSAPVGLFEIGLGITVGAAVMFIGILVYNFAIRLIPFAMKMLAKLLALGFRRGKEGIGAIRRLLQNA